MAICAFGYDMSAPDDHACMAFIAFLQLEELICSIRIRMMMMVMMSLQQGEFVNPDNMHM